MLTDFRVPFVGLKQNFQENSDSILEIVFRTLSNGDLIMRDDLELFEKNVAKFLGSKYALGLNSGTDAMMLSLLAEGIGDNDEVITVGHTFVATVAAIKHTGATPILIDVGLDHNLNVELLKAAITPRTKAIIPVHLNGRLCDMDELMEIANHYNLIIVEDACQSWGASYNGKKAGTFGLTGCFSLYPMKTLGGYGDGGVVVTDDDDVYEKICLLRDHGQKRTSDGIEITGYGYNSRLDNIQAALLNFKLDNLCKDINRRRYIASIYDAGLTGFISLKLPPGPSIEGMYWDTFQNYVIESSERDELARFLNDAGVETLISWPKPMHKFKGLGLEQFDLPQTVVLSKKVLSLPMYPELQDSQVNYVISKIGEFYS